MSLPKTYFSKVTPAVYEVFRGSSKWAQDNVKPYTDLDERIKRKIETVVREAYHEIANVVFETDKIR